MAGQYVLHVVARMPMTSSLVPQPNWMVGTWGGAVLSTLTAGPDVLAPWMVLEYLPYGDLNKFLTVSEPV